MDNSLKSIYQQIACIGRRFDADRVVLYGSRARGDHRSRSDVDIAVFGAPEHTYAAFWDALEELPTLLEFDLTYVNSHTSPALLDNIRKDGIVLMDKLQEKYEKLVRAVKRLDDSIADYDRLELDSIRDGVIQRFEFSAELAWKTTREYLIDQGHEEINSPKAVMRKAYAVGLIGDEQAWIDLLTARNLTSHLYDEESAQSIFLKIRNVYCSLFKQLVEQLAI